MRRMLAAVLFAMMISPYSAHPVPLISIVPSSTTIRIGELANFDVVISGLGNGQAPSLSTFDLDVMFDPSILGFSGFIFGDAVLGDQLDLLGLGAISSSGVPVLGQVNLFELSLDPAAILGAMQAPAFSLGTLTFAGLSAGDTPLTISINALGDAIGDPLSATLQNAAVTVSVIDEPGTASLLWAALALLPFAYRRGWSGRRVRPSCDIEVIEEVIGALSRDAISHLVPVQQRTSARLTFSAEPP